MLSFFYGETYVGWQLEFVGALLWMAIVVSIGALSILYVLIRQLEISQVSSLFYLMPVSSVLLSIVLLEEPLNSNEVVGILLTSLAVFLVNTNLSARQRVSRSNNLT